MAGASSIAVLRDIQTLFDSGTASGVTDRQLLDRFVSRRDSGADAAFEALVLRHGPMILRVCHNSLRDPNDVQDAFQATFLVLVQRSGSIRKLDSIGGWLYGVAARARVDAARRRSAEERSALRSVEVIDPRGNDDAENAAFGTVVQQEVRRLPEKYRAVLALCYWQGLTHEQAATQLGCPLGTVRSRMARARNLLRRRLIRRGLAPLAGIVMAGLDRSSASEITGQLLPVPTELIHATIQAAVGTASGQGTGRVASGVIAALVQHVLWSMTMINIKIGVAGLALAILVISGGWFTSSMGKGKLTHVPRALERESAAPSQKPQAKVSTSERLYSLVRGQVLMAVADGGMVKKGALVCEIDSAPLNDQLINQRITLNSAEANYENAKLARETAEIAVVEYQDGIFPFRHEETAGNIKIAEAELALAQYEAKAAAGSNQLNLKRAELAVFRAQFALEKAQSKKKLLLEFTKGKKIKELKSAVEKARADELAKKAIRELESSKERKLERMIADCRIRAPRDGTVRFLVVDGDVVRERQALFEIIPSPAANPEKR